MRKIIKRDGRKEVFDERKIFVAIDKAFSAADIDDDAKVESVVDDVLAKIDVIYKDNKLPKVEDIQDLIEDTLIEHGESAVAKRFILYRAERTRIREANTSLMHTLHDLTFK
ncbi:MAG: ATP cone domain-containing protein, partial [Bacilli bacterium]